jgi:hypothetical protein
MMTVAVAARKPQSQGRYRFLLGQTGVEAHFVTDLNLLIKCVKSRPIDVVIFDLDDPRLPARKWLDAARLDTDIGLVPVLWIGSEVPASDLQAVEEYRPGLRLAKLPDAATLLQTVERLMGVARLDGEDHLSTSQALKPPTWKPETDTIDDALCIFADPAKDRPAEHPPESPGQPRSSPLTTTSPDDARGVAVKDGGEDYDWFVTEMIKTETAPGQPRPDPSFIDVVPSGGTEKRILLSKLNDESAGGGSGSEGAEEIAVGVPISDDLSTTDQSSVPSARQIPSPQSSPVSGVDSALVDRIAREVAAQLANEILKSLDPDTIRQAVETALARPR